MTPEPTELAPGEQAPAWRITAPLGRLARWALVLWGVLALLLWAGSWLFGQAQAGPLAQARRLAELAGPGLLFLAAPVLLLPLVMVLLHKPWLAGLERALLMGLVAQLGLGGVWLALALLALVQQEDPWERMPFVFPPYLERFRATHPGITLTTLNRVSTVRLHAQGQSMQVDGPEIAAAQVRLERCTQAPGLAALQGLAMPPRARCAAVLTLQRDGDTTVRWQYEMDRNTPADTLRQHFDAWARAEAVDSSDNTPYQFSARKGARQWQVDIVRDRTAPLRLVVAPP